MLCGNRCRYGVSYCEWCIQNGCICGVLFWRYNLLCEVMYKSVRSCTCSSVGVIEISGGEVHSYCMTKREYGGNKFSGSDSLVGTDLVTSERFWDRYLSSKAVTIGPRWVKPARLELPRRSLMTSRYCEPQYDRFWIFTST
jgi:hypothetical protein